MCAGSTMQTASAGVTTPSATMSLAMRRAALPVRLPLRVCSMNRRPSMTVNSQSCMSFMWRSSRDVQVRRSSYASGKSSAMREMGCGVRMPATTSSPCGKRKARSQRAQLHSCPLQGTRLLRRHSAQVRSMAA